jgi:hypothetical protein
LPELAHLSVPCRVSTIQQVSAKLSLAFEVESHTTLV